MRLLWLSLGLVPYLSLAGIDAWMHERHRRVPRIEQALHAGLAIAIGGFLTGVFTQRTALAAVALAAFIALLVADEAGFHRGIAARERRVHVASWIALAGFVLLWRVLGDAP
jgi:hypothetical protein